MRISDVLSAKSSQEVVTIKPDAGVRDLLALLAGADPADIDDVGPELDGGVQRGHRRLEVGMPVPTPERVARAVDDGHHAGRPG